MSFAELTAIITAKGGPQNSGTMAEYNKFAEPENFTGAYAANLGLGVRMRRHADLDWKLRLTERPKVTPGGSERRSRCSTSSAAARTAR